MLYISRAVRLVDGFGVVGLSTDYLSKALSFEAKTGYIIIQEKEKFTCFTVWNNEECEEVLHNYQITTLDELYDLLSEHAKLAI